MEGFPINKNIEINNAILVAIRSLKEKAYIKTGDKLVFVVGIPMNKREAVNSIHVSEVE